MLKLLIFLSALGVHAVAHANNIVKFEPEYYATLRLDGVTLEFPSPLAALQAKKADYQEKVDANKNADIRWKPILSSPHPECRAEPSTINGLSWYYCLPFEHLYASTGEVRLRSTFNQWYSARCPEYAKDTRPTFVSIGDLEREAWCEIDCEQNADVSECQICPPPFIMNSDTDQCEARCDADASWNPGSGQCETPPVAYADETQSCHPIDFIQGHKYRTEAVISVGGRFPIELRYLYNNQANAERTPGGPIDTINDTSNEPDATMDPIPRGDYQVFLQQNPQKAPKNFGMPARYWRHNYEESLVAGDGAGQLVWHRAKGESIVLPAAGGASPIYPSIRIQPVGTGDAGVDFEGYKITQGSRHKYFDDQGRLRLVRQEGSGLSHELTYDEQDRHKLVRITHSTGQFLAFEYEPRTIRSVYALEPFQEHYPVLVKDHTGLHSEILWNTRTRGVSRGQYLLRAITYPHEGEAALAREFSYEDERFPFSITQIRDTNLTTGQARVYANFVYDHRGRATGSSLTDGAEALSVAYPDEHRRVVTNALGKQTNYHFEEFNGVRRLAQINGEPTANCAPTEVTYHYDTAGNVTAQHQNGGISTYTYNARGLEVSRTEAAGTPEARTIKTEWHSTLNLKTKVVTEEQTTVMTYDDTGRLTSKTVQATNPQ